MAERDGPDDSNGTEGRHGARGPADWLGAALLTAAPFVLFALFVLLDRLIR